MPLSTLLNKGNKNAEVSKHIIYHFLRKGNDTIASLANELRLSVPTVSKLLDEMAANNIVKEQGKLEACGGRHPSLYGLNPDVCYFAGIDMKGDSLSLAITDMCGNVVDKEDGIHYKFDNSPAMLDKLCSIVKTWLAKASIPKSKIARACLNISGRVNPHTGYSYSRFCFDERPLTDVLTQKIGIETTIENDTRAMAYGEYMLRQPNSEKNLLFVNVSHGLGLGLIIDGKIYYGKSGFAGEIGHVVTYNNEVICHCGKKGCLETEASGSALLRKLTEKLDNGANSVIAERYKQKGYVSLDDVLKAVNREDLLCLELIEYVGLELGHWIAGLINIFNPETVIIGGTLAQTGDYLLQPIKVTMQRFSLSLVNNDTRVELSQLGHDAGVLGACAIARNRMFDKDY